MWEDPIIEELHHIREEHAAQFNYNLDAIFQDLKQKEKQSGLQYVSYDAPQPTSLRSGNSERSITYETREKEKSEDNAHERHHF